MTSDDTQEDAIDDTDEDLTTPDNTVDCEDVKTSVMMSSDSVMETSLSSSVTDLEHTYCGQMETQTGTPLVVQLGQPSVVYTDPGSTVPDMEECCQTTDVCPPYPSTQASTVMSSSVMETPLCRSIPHLEHTYCGKMKTQTGTPVVVQQGQPSVVYADPGSTVPDMGMVEVRSLSDGVRPSTQASTMKTQTGTPVVVQLGQPLMVRLGQPSVVFAGTGSTVPDVGTVEVRQLSDGVLPSTQASTVLSSDVTSSLVGTTSVVPVTTSLIHLGSLVSDVVQPTGPQQYSQPAVTGTQQRGGLVVTRVVNPGLQHITLPLTQKHAAQVNVSYVTPVTANHTPSAVGGQAVTYEFIQPQHTVLANQQPVQLQHTTLASQQSGQPQLANQQPVQLQRTTLANQQSGQPQSTNQQSVLLQRTTLASQQCVQSQSASQQAGQPQSTNQQSVQLQCTTLASQQRVHPQSTNQQCVQSQSASQQAGQPQSTNQQSVQLQRTTSASKQRVQLQHTASANQQQQQSVVWKMPSVQPRHTSLVNQGRLQQWHTASTNEQQVQSQHTELASPERSQAQRIASANQKHVQPRHTALANQQSLRSGTAMTSAKPQLSVMNVREQDTLGLASDSDEMLTQYSTAPAEPVIPDWVQYNTQQHQQQQHRSLYVEYDTLQSTHLHRLVQFRAVTVPLIPFPVQFSSVFQQSRCFSSVFTALHEMQMRSCDENSVCPSVRPSVRPSVKCVNCDKTAERYV